MGSTTARGLPAVEEVQQPRDLSPEGKVTQPCGLIATGQVQQLNAFRSEDEYSPEGQPDAFF
jgi:hypothetical protein